MDLLQLKYFKDAAQFENFSKAAEVNFVPQSSISKAVKILENQYNTPLFDRIGKNIYLNDNGRFLYQEVCGIFDRLDSCTHHFAQVRPNHIIVYVQDAAFFVPLVTTDYMHSHPKTHITFSNTMEVLHSTRSTYDFTFMPETGDMANYDFEPLLEDEVVALVSKEHPLAAKDEIDVKELEEELFISFYYSMWLRTITHNVCEQIGGFQPRVVFETHDEFAVIHLVAKNAGVTLMPGKLYNVHKHKNIKVLKLKKTLTSKTVLAWSKEKHLSKDELEFIQFSKKWFDEVEERSDWND